MARQLTPLGRGLIVVCGLSLVGYGLYRYGVLDKIIPKAKERPSVVPPKADLPGLPESRTPTWRPRPCPAAAPAAPTSPRCAPHLGVERADGR